jgi:outer membrane biosynthesis protein TonB
MQDQPTGYSSVEEPAWRERLRAWFTQPPYLGPIAIGAFTVGFMGLALVASPSRSVDQRASSERQVALAPAPEQPSQPVASVEIGDRASPEVSVRTLDEKANAPANAPLGDLPLAGNGPEGVVSGNGPLEPVPSTLPTVPEPGLPSPVDVPSPTSTPEPVPQPSVPAPEPPPVPAPRFEPEPEPQRAPERIRVRRPRPVQVAPPRDTGRMTIYFDADSSTFDRGGDRLPLRVQVYVNGVKRLETDDPEKREFEIDNLPAGEHDIQIVPYVGNAPADPRREVVRIRPRRPNEFKAVLRRSDGASRISKFEER